MNWNALIALLISAGIVYGVVHEFGIFSVVLLLLTSFFIYVAMLNMTGSNKLAALSPSVYPPPPHLGLDGVSLENRASF